MTTRLGREKPPMLRAIGRFLKGIKDAWEWYSILVLFGVVPGATVLLGAFEGQPWSVLTLYASVALAFWLVLLREGHEIADYIRLRRRRLRISMDACCRQGERVFLGIDKNGRLIGRPSGADVESPYLLSASPSVRAAAARWSP